MGNTPTCATYGHGFYDDFLLVFYDVIFLFIINVQAKTSSVVTYDRYENFVIER
jgi:hypothetical protein